MEKSKSGGSFCCSTPLAPFFICIIISFRPAWLARALLSFKRAQSSGNDNADEGQHVPFDALMVVGVYAISLVSFHGLTSIKADTPRYE